MRVSVVIPVYNGAAYLEEALESVFGQTQPVDEIIVVDDGSTDRSPELLASYGDRIILIRQQNGGVAVARNAGLARATGDLISFLDQDDIWPAERTRVMSEAFQRNPEAKVVAGQVDTVYQRSTPPPSHVVQGLLHREYLLGSLLVRGEVFNDIGRLNTDVGWGDDTEFLIRRREENIDTLYIEETVLIYRFHDLNTSLSHSDQKQQMLVVLHQTLRRRRSDG